MIHQQSTARTASLAVHILNNESPTTIKIFTRRISKHDDIPLRREIPEEVKHSLEQTGNAEITRYRRHSFFQELCQLLGASGCEVG